MLLSPFLSANVPFGRAFATKWNWLKSLSSSLLVQFLHALLMEEVGRWVNLFIERLRWSPWPPSSTTTSTKFVVTTMVSSTGWRSDNFRLKGDRIDGCFW